MKLLTRDEVLEIVPMSRAMLYVEVRAGRFPSPIRLGRRRVAWREDELMSWVQNRPRAAGDGLKA